jgi:hypothetical protein
MAVESVYISDHEEKHAPPSSPVLKVSAFTGGHVMGDPEREYMKPVVYLAVGDFDEASYEDHFASSRERQVAVDLDELMNALIAVGVLVK